MDSTEINIEDAETGEKYKLHLSPTSAYKAQTGASEYMQKISNNLPSAEISNYQDMSPLEEEMEIETCIENKENCRWSHAAIMLLIEEYRLREPAMSSGKMIHKKTWDEIARTMNSKDYNICGKQCMTKINTMKRTYKTIKDHNAKSGNNKRTWKYYDVMESLLGEKPFISPLTTISSTGLITSKPGTSESPGSSKTSESNDAIFRKRKAADNIEMLLHNRRITEDDKNKRHEERMEMAKRLLDTLEKLVQKQ